MMDKVRSIITTLPIYFIVILISFIEVIEYKYALLIHYSYIIIIHALYFVMICSQVKDASRRSSSLQQRRLRGRERANEEDTRKTNKTKIFQVVRGTKLEENEICEMYDWFYVSNHFC